VGAPLGVAGQKVYEAVAATIGMKPRKVIDAVSMAEGAQESCARARAPYFYDLHRTVTEPPPVRWPTDVAAVRREPESTCGPS
jgi:hypothetical protein